MSDSEKPNIVLLVLDAVRAKSISAYGRSIRKTPFLDAFAAKNVLFKRAFSPGTWTIPTHSSMLTGLYLSQHRIESTKADRYFNDAIVPLPTALQAHGYRTAAFSQNFLFSPKYQFGYFQEYHDMDGLRKSKSLFRSHRSGALQNSFVGRYLRKVTGVRLFLDSMLDWIQTSNEEQPFFLMANLANVHYPWAPPPGALWRELGFKVRHLRNQELVQPGPFQFNSGKRKVTKLHREFWFALYHAALSHADREVGRFLRRLQQWSGWSNTIVVITADHGEMLGDYEDIVGHMLTLHDNLLHVPLIVRHPKYSENMVVEQVVQNMDLYASILEWTGCPVDGIPTAQLQRPSLSVAMQAPNAVDGVAFAEEDYTDSYNPVHGLLRVNPKMEPTKYPRRQISVHTATHKYIWAEDQPGKFYNIKSDPDESRNLIDTGTPAEQAVLKELNQALEGWRTSLKYFPPNRINQDLKVDPVTMDRLRNLGYVE